MSRKLGIFLREKASDRAVDRGSESDSAKTWGGDVDAFLADNRNTGKKRPSKAGLPQGYTPEGPKVLEALPPTALGLHNGQLDASWDCLRKVGNLSSASVLVVLEDVIKHRRPEPGAMGLLAAMGPVYLLQSLPSAMVKVRGG